MGGGKRRYKEKLTRCKICGRWLKSLGIARHRAMHRDKEEKQKRLFE